MSEHAERPAAALVAVYARCNLPSASADWSRWYDETHLPDLLDDLGAPAIATRWQLTEQPVPGMPSVGFSHVTLYELRSDDPLAAVDRLLARDRELLAADRIHPNHAVTNVDVFVPQGRWTHKPPPSVDLRGHILAYVLCTDPRREDEWNDWYDRDHIPDMMDSGAFAAATRWVHAHRRGLGAEYLTLYDVTLDDVSAAVERSASVMPGIVAAGRKHPCHCGALTVTLEAAGSLGGAGYRASDSSGS